MDKTTIYLPSDLRLYLRDAARRAGKSQAELIREAIDAKRAGDTPTLPASVGAFRSGTNTGITREKIKRDYHAYLDRKHTGDAGA